MTIGLHDPIWQLNRFAPTLPQIVDFYAASGAERSSELQTWICGLQQFGLQVFAPIGFSAENREIS